MLVIAPNLVLTAAEAALPAGVPLIGWHNIVTASNIEANDEDPNYPASNLANPATNQEWRALQNSPPTVDVYLTVTTNYVDEIDYVAIARHNFGTGSIPVSIERFDGNQMSPPDDTWTEIVGPQIPPNDEPLLFAFTGESMEKIRVKLGEGDEIPRAGVLNVGKLLRAERGFPVNKAFTPPRFGRKTKVLTGRSEAGDYLGRIVQNTFVEPGDLAFEHLTADWYREHFDPFVEAAENDRPFFFSWSPDDYPYEVGFCWFAGDAQVTVNHATERMNFQVKLGGIFE